MFGGSDLRIDGPQTVAHFGEFAVETLCICDHFSKLSAFALDHLHDFLDRQHARTMLLR